MQGEVVQIDVTWCFGTRRGHRAGYGRRGWRVGVRSSNSGDIREERERGEGECSQSEERDVRGEKGEARQGAAAAAEAASQRSSGVTIAGMDLPGLFFFFFFFFELV